MPDQLKDIVQRMIDAGEPEENIAQVIQNYKPPAANVPPSTFKNDATSFWGGVGQNLMQGDSMKASLKGGLGFLKGATFDIPSSIGGALSNIGESISDPVGTLKGGWGAITHPGETLSGLWNPIAETTSKAGSDPEAFGRMMGQVTGQPLTTYGLAKGAVAPKTLRGVGRAAQATGKFVSEQKPLTGWMPPFLEPRLARGAQALGGRGLSAIGRGLERAGTPVVEGEPMYWAGPPWKEGEIIPEPPAQMPSGTAPIGRGLPPSETDFYAGSGATERGLMFPEPGNISPMGQGVPPPPPIMPPPPPTPRLLPSRGEQFNLPQQSATSVPGQFTDVTTGQVLSPEELVARMARPTPKPAPTPKVTPVKSEPTIEIIEEPSGPINNASGESSASAENISRMRGMKKAGQQHVVYDRAGNKRPIPDGVDYKVRPGETYGIETPQGFQVLDDMGGRPPRTGAPTKSVATSKPRGSADIGKVYRVMKDKMTPEFLEKSHKNGFQMVGQTPAGDFLFKKVR